MWNVLYLILKTIQAILAELQAIRRYLVGRDEVANFYITITRNEDKMNLEIYDDGKGLTYTAAPDKQLKTGELPTWAVTQGDASALVLAPSADGLSCVGTLPSPPKDATGIVVTISLTRLDGVQIHDDADPIDIIPDPNGEVGSFVITEAAN